MLSRAFAAVAVLLSVSMLRADFTMGYEIFIDIPARLSPEMAKRLKDGARTRLPEFLTLQARGNKGFFGTSKFKVIVDYPRQEVTLIEPASKRFATVSMQEYPAALRASMREIPGPVRAVLGAAKPKFALEKTGRSDFILGLPAEEYKATFAIDPATAPALAAKYHDPIAKTVMRLWVSAPEDLVKTGVSYYMDKLQWLVTNMNLVVLTQMGLGAMPGGGQEFTAAIAELTKNNALVVQAELDLYAPTIGMMESDTSEVNGAIVAEVIAELGGLSFDPIEDADLSVPPEFMKVSAQEILSKPTGATTK